MTSQLRTLMLLALVPAAVSAQQKVTLPAQDKVLRERPTAVYQVGAEDGEDWELLSGVRQVAFDAADNLFILDGNNARVLMFNAAGKFVRQIGKKGGGPGEFQAPVGLTIANDGTLVISDIGRRGYSLFKPEGTFIKNVVWDDGLMIGLGGGLQPHPKGGVVGRGNQFMMMGGPGREGGARSGGASIQLPAGGGTSTRNVSQPVKIHWTNLTTGKTTELFEVETPPIPQRVEQSGGEGRQNVRVSISQPEFMPQVSFGVLSNGGLAVTHEADYRVKVIDPAGKLTRTIERPIAPKKATQKDKELALQRRRERMASGVGAVAIRWGDGGNTSVTTGAPGSGNNDLPSIDEMLRNTTFHDVIPVLRGIDTDLFGRLWIRRTPADLGDTGPIDLVTAEGRYIGTIPNDRVPNAVSRSGRAAYIERDELNVEHVVVRKLPATWNLTS